MSTRYRAKGRRWRAEGNIMKARYAIALAPVILMCTGTRAQQVPAVLQGKVVNASRQPVPTASVTYARIPDTTLNSAGKWVPVPGQPSVAATVATASAGTFSASGLPPGTYQVCVEAPGYLPSCAWSGSKWVALAAGQQMQLEDTVLLEAAAIRIRIADPQHLLPAVSVPSRVLNVGVREAGGAYYTATQTASDANGRNAEVDVPFGRPLQFWVYSWKYRISDVQGAPLNPSGARIPFQADTSKPLPTFTITIVDEAGSD